MATAGVGSAPRVEVGDGSGAANSHLPEEGCSNISSKSNSYTKDF